MAGLSIPDRTVTELSRSRWETSSFKVDWPNSVRRLRDTWKPYREAALGFRNHWYPACYTNELENNGDPIAVKLLGEPIILRQVDGAFYALEDRCAHRRVPLSHKFECYTKDTVTCWYHGLTYNWTDGKLSAVLGGSHRGLIDRIGVKTYNVQATKDIVFVYVGDGDPPPLSHDVPPGFLDEDRVTTGWRRVVDSNWRWAVENGFDSTHLYLHHDNELSQHVSSIYPIGVEPVGNHREAIQYVTEGDGPVGLIDELMDNYEPVFSSDIGEAKEVVTADLKLDSEEITPLVPVISIWMPCCLAVEGFPLHDMGDFEFYVPIDETRHMYWQTLTTFCKSDKESAEFVDRAQSHWADIVFDGFNGDDIAARVALQSGYTDGDGWNQEILSEDDTAVIAWRQLASQFNRGIQPVPESANRAMAARSNTSHGIVVGKGRGS